MRNFPASLLLLGISALGLSAQTSTASRPRVAGTPVPPQIQNDPSSGQSRTSQSGPPTLINPNARSTPANANPAPSPPAGDDEVIKIETNLVTMPVSVLDRDARFISGLQQKDFKIYENGVEQKLDYFQNVEQPFTVVMLIDVSPSTQFKIEEIQNAAMTFVDQLRPSDRVVVIAFDQDVHVLCPATNNRLMLKNAIRQAEFGDGTSLYEAVQFTIENQLRGIQGRKAVVLFTDGVDTTSRRNSYQTTIAESEEVDALFYTVRYDTSRDMNGRWNGGYSNRRRGGGGSWSDIFGSIIMGGNMPMGGGRNPGSASASEYEMGKQYLNTLSQNSGGRAFEAQSIYNVQSAFAGIAEELRQQYSIGYYPDKVGQVGDRKQIKIRVMRPNVVVRAKTSYVVGQTTRNLAGK